MDWESGLPNINELPPLSHLLISPELASAFNITPEPHRSMIDVTSASHKTLLTLNSSISSSDDEREDHEMAVEAADDESSARSSKRIRLVWTPQLHRRFVEVVKHLGVKKAVPKTIMQLMNVEGLTRENVASHLQKYRLYVKRMPGLISNKPDRPVGVSRRVPVSIPYMVPMVHHHGFSYHSHPYNMMMHNFGSVSPYQQAGMTSNDK